jgi:hypothetical protein
MNDDQYLRSLFAEQPAVSDDQAFEARVLLGVARAARRRRWLWWGIDVLAVLLVWLIAEPLQAAVEWLMPWVVSSVVELGDSPWALLLQPVNSFASVLALLFLLGRSVYRRLLR